MTFRDRAARLPSADVVARQFYGIEFRRGVAQCPFKQNHNHGDHDPSLRWDRRKGRVFCASQQCFGEQGADTIELVRVMEHMDSPSAALQKLEERYGTRTPTTTVNQKSADAVRALKARQSFRVAAIFPYGVFLRKVRMEHESRKTSKGRPEKTFIWEHRDGDNWLSGKGGQVTPLYVNEQFRSNDQVETALGLEGEQKADYAGTLGFAAFSFGDFTQKNVSVLRDLNVVLWPDKDAPGKAKAERAAAAIRRAGARSVRMIEPPSELQEGGDIVDAIDVLGWDGRRLEKLLASARPHELQRAEEPTSRVPQEKSRCTLKVWTLTELRRAEFATAEPLVEDFLAAGESVLLVGKPKVGKSRLVQQLAIAMSRGQPFLDHPVSKPRRVLMLDLENRPAGARARFGKMSKPDADGDGRVYIYAPDTLVGSALRLCDTEGVSNLERLVSESQPDVIIIDTWRLLLGGGDENKNETVVRGLKALSRLRQILPSLGTIIVHHLRKQQGENPPRLRIDPAAWVEASSGHYSLIGHVDACFGLEREVDSRTGDELLVFGGVARSAAPRTLILEDDPDTLLFRVAQGEDAAAKLFTAVERTLWDAMAALRTFSFTDVLERSQSKNKKAVASMLRKAESVGLLEKCAGKSYRRRN